MFRDRFDAGRLLAATLQEYRGRPDTVVLALPRGGVPVAYAVATELHLPLDIFAVRKLGVPGQEELAMGAIASGDVRVLNPDIIEAIGLTTSEMETVTAHEKAELERREALYRGGRPAADVRGKTVILIDDGLATGASMRVAITALRLKYPGQIIVAVPVAPSSTCRELRQIADQVICAEMPDPFYAVGQAYKKFEQVSDDEVKHLLETVI